MNRIISLERRIWLLWIYYFNWEHTGKMGEGDNRHVGKGEGACKGEIRLLQTMLA